METEAWQKESLRTSSRICRSAVGGNRGHQRLLASNVGWLGWLDKESHGGSTKLSHSVCFCWSRTTPSVLKCGVPQGSALGPLLFTLYTQSLNTVICQSGHSYHLFAEDSQLHNLSIPSDFPLLVHSLKDCIEDVAVWTSGSMLKMNND